MSVLESTAINCELDRQIRFASGQKRSASDEYCIGFNAALDTMIRNFQDSKILDEVDTASRTRG